MTAHLERLNRKGDRVRDHRLSPSIPAALPSEGRTTARKLSAPDGPVLGSSPTELLDGQREVPGVPTRMIGKTRISCRPKGVRTSRFRVVIEFLLSGVKSSV